MTNGHNTGGVMFALGMSWPQKGAKIFRGGGPEIARQTRCRRLWWDGFYGQKPVGEKGAGREATERWADLG
jgi:hypothetical protein